MRPSQVAPPASSRLNSDLDFEYPANADQGKGFANLFTELRTAFDALATKKGDKVPYELSVRKSFD